MTKDYTVSENYWLYYDNHVKSRLSQKSSGKFVKSLAWKHAALQKFNIYTEKPGKDLTEKPSM
jgi:hypothetical protein